MKKVIFFLLFVLFLNLCSASSFERLELINPDNVWKLKYNNVLIINTFDNSSFGIDVDDIKIFIESNGTLNYSLIEIRRTSIGSYEAVLYLTENSVLEYHNISVTVEAYFKNSSQTNSIYVEVYDRNILDIVSLKFNGTIKYLKADLIRTIIILSLWLIVMTIVVVLITMYFVTDKKVNLK